MYIGSAFFSYRTAGRLPGRKTGLYARKDIRKNYFPEGGANAEKDTDRVHFVLPGEAVRSPAGGYPESGQNLKCIFSHLITRASETDIETDKETDTISL